MKSGLFITFEGPDGSGKTTQIRGLTTYMIEQGFDTVVTREPGGTVIGEKIREIILDREHMEMDAVTEALLYAASRAQHVAQVIAPALEKGKTVICDRFVDSSIAYQGYGRKLGDRVSVINQIAVAGLVPDLTFLLVVDPDEGKRRIRNEQLDRLELEETEYHQDVYKGYMKLAQENSHRIVLIDGSVGIEEIRQEIILKVGMFIMDKRGCGNGTD